MDRDVIEHKEKVFIKSSEITDDCYRLLNYIEDCYAIVGVARSGIFPASFLSTISNSRLISYENKNGTITDLKGGMRTDGVYGNNDSKNIYILDDSCYTGRAMKYAKSRIQRQFKDKNIITMALYSRREPYEVGMVDYVSRVLHDHYFEWNIFASPMCKRVCIDFDGILCRDFRPHEDDDGETYLNTLQNMSLDRVRPQSKWPVDIITARLEKWRKPTEDWLKKNKINYGNLIMAPWNNISERFNNDIASWKAEKFKESNKMLYIESDHRQAIKIHLESGKEVIHYNSGRLFASNYVKINDTVTEEGLNECTSIC